MNIKIALLIAALLFVSGIYIILTRKNAIAVLIGIELTLNAANLNFIAFNSTTKGLEGQTMALFVMVIAAAEMAIALALIIKIYTHLKSTNLEDISTLHG